MEKLDNAMDYFMSKPYRKIRMGIWAPPPPRPPMLEATIIKTITTQPAYSTGSSGKTLL